MRCGAIKWLQFLDLFSHFRRILFFFDRGNLTCRPIYNVPFPIKISLITAIPVNVSF
jgi:hypothetical protein